MAGAPPALVARPSKSHGLGFKAWGLGFREGLRRQGFKVRGFAVVQGGGSRIVILVYWAW